MRKIIILTLAFTLLLTGCGKQAEIPKTAKELKMEKAGQQIDNYKNYQADSNELTKIVSYEGMNYYYASNGKRYTFPNETILLSWFPNLDITTINQAELDTLYETQLGGNVSLRPGSLMITETDPKTYLITNDNEMKIFGNLTLLENLYGENHEQYIIEIPNKFYTQYNNTGSINQPEQIPQISLTESIDQNLGF